MVVSEEDTVKYIVAASDGFPVGNVLVFHIQIDAKQEVDIFGLGGHDGFLVHKSDAGVDTVAQGDQVGE